MAIERCPNPLPDCPWFGRPTPKCLRSTQEHGCFSDLDHILPRFLGRTSLQRRFIERPENKQQLCRWEHDEKTFEDENWPPILPDAKTMRQMLALRKESGIVEISSPEYQNNTENQNEICQPGISEAA